MKTLGKVIKIILTVMVFAVIGFLIFRIFLMNSEGVLGDVTPTANAVAAFGSGAENAFLTNEIHDQISSNEEGGDGFFSAYAFLYLPEQKEVQVTVRMNDSTPTNAGLGDIPPYFFLKFNENGEDTGEVRDPAYTEEEHRLMYTYRRLVFTDVEITDITNLILCLSDTGDSSGSVSEFVIHFQEQPLENYKLSGDDREILENGAKQ